MPLQGPTKYELFVNLKAAKAIGITLPLALADDPETQARNSAAFIRRAS